MNKKLGSISIAIIIVFAACKQSPKQNNAPVKIDDNKTKTELAHTSFLTTQTDSSLTGHTKSVPGKPSCCVAPPSRFKAKVEKK